MNLLNLAIAFALIGLLGVVLLFLGNPLSIFLILLAELGAFVCVWTDERMSKQKISSFRR